MQFPDMIVAITDFIISSLICSSTAADVDDEDFARWAASWASLDPDQSVTTAPLSQPTQPTIPTLMPFHIAMDAQQHPEYPNATWQWDGEGTPPPPTRPADHTFMPFNIAGAAELDPLYPDQ